MRLRLVARLVTGALFMEVLDGNIIANALPQMAVSLGANTLCLNNVVSQVGMTAGITLSAMCVQSGQMLAKRMPFGATAAEYKGALVVAVVALAELAGLTNTLCLPKGVGDHFVCRS